MINSVTLCSQEKICSELKLLPHNLHLHRFMLKIQFHCFTVLCISLKSTTTRVEGSSALWQCQQTTEQLRSPPSPLMVYVNRSSSDDQRRRQLVLGNCLAYVVTYSMDSVLVKLKKFFKKDAATRTMMK